MEINSKNGIQIEHGENRARTGYAFVELKDQKDFETAMKADLKSTNK